MPLGDPAGYETPTATERPLGRLMLAQFSAVSNAIAGGQRIDVNEVLPGGGRVDAAEGFIPDEYLAVAPEVGFDPAMFAQADPNDPATYDLSAIPAAGTGSGTDGDGLDWYRSGQAPSNYANRNNPLYVARADFISDQVAPLIGRLFPGMNVTGQGYYRPPDTEGQGGQAVNSDHQSAGALDIFGSPEQMEALRNWAITQPWVSFIRYGSDHHHDHVHMSIDLGWVAEHVFGGRAPDIETGPPPATEAPELPEPTETPTAVPAGAGGKAV